MLQKISILMPILFFGCLLLACQAKKDKNLVELRVDTDPTISFRIWFQVGSQDDPEGKEGLAALTASMLTDAGTEQNSYGEILEKLYPMAAGYGASVDKEMTVITGRVHKDNLDAYLELLIQAILHPAFAEEDFQRIKTNTVNFLEKTLRYSNDELFGKETLYRMVFRGTAYGHPEAGLIESVKSMSLDHVKEFYKSHFTRDNAVIGIGGNYDPATIEKLRDALNSLPPLAIRRSNKPRLDPLEGRTVTLVEKNTQSTAISFGFPIGVLRGEKDYYALWIANSWLGEHRNSSSHLYQVIREARGLNYGDYSYIEAFPNGSFRQFPQPNVARRRQMFEVWIRPVPNEAALFSLRAAIRELDRLIGNGMTQEQFDLTRRFLKKYRLHYASTTSMRLGYKLDDRFYGLEDHLETLGRMLDELTLEDVNQAIRRHLQTENMAIAMITQDAKALKKAMAGDAPSPMKYSTPKPQEVLDEDKVIEVYPLKIKERNILVVDADDMFVK